MARKKKVFTHYENAVTRSSNCKSIDPALDLGGELTMVEYDNRIASLRTKINEYNTFLSLVDEKHADMMAFEKALKDYSERFLNAIAGKYGRNSEEYEKAGGKRKDLIKRSPNKPKI